MNTLEKLQRNWEGLAQADPLYAICADPRKRNRDWSKEDLFATGRNEVAVVLGCIAELGIQLDKQSPALDFGCGIGRLTRALAEHFPECWGVDISPTMISLAREFNHHIPECRFILNEKDRLECLDDNYFGFIYTSIVLQHIAPALAARYIAELIRVLKPGGSMVFQVADSLREGTITRLRVRLAVRARMQSLLGIQRPFSMEMHCINESRLRQLVRRAGAEIVDVRLTNSVEPSFCGNLTYLKQEPESGYVSKQYCVVKRS